jgi:acyl-CoA thioesterase
MNKPPLTPQQRAERSAETMLAQDLASTQLGMALDAIAPGYARLRMSISATMLNGHKTCHGGYIFTLADSCFAFACNTYNRVTVAAGASIEFLAPAYQDDELTAVATEQVLGAKTGVYDVIVTNQQAQRIALFRGRSHRIQGVLFAEPPD